MGTGLTFDEYIELTALPLAGADPVFVQAVEEEREQMFPMKLLVAANHLRSRGYDCRPASLEVLIRNSIANRDRHLAGDELELECLSCDKLTFSIGSACRARWDST